MSFDEFAAWRYIITHQHREDIVGFCCVFDVYLFQDTGFRIHGCFPQLFRIHFTQTFVALCMNTVFRTVAIPLHEVLALFVGIAVFADLTFGTFVQRRIGDVEVSSLDDFRHVAVEESHDKGVDV